MTEIKREEHQKQRESIAMFLVVMAISTEEAMAYEILSGAKRGETGTRRTELLKVTAESI